MNPNNQNHGQQQQQQQPQHLGPQIALMRQQQEQQAQQVQYQLQQRLLLEQRLHQQLASQLLSPPVAPGPLLGQQQQQLQLLLAQQQKEQLAALNLPLETALMLNEMNPSQRSSNKPSKKRKAKVLVPPAAPGTSTFPLPSQKERKVVPLLLESFQDEWERLGQKEHLFVRRLGKLRTTKMSRSVLQEYRTRVLEQGNKSLRARGA